MGDDNAAALRCLARFDCQRTEAAGEQEAWHGSITQKTQNRIVLCFTVKLGMLFASWSAASQVFSRCQKVEEVACAVAPQNQILCFRERCKKCGVVCAECAGVEIDCFASIELAKSFTQSRDSIARKRRCCGQKCTLIL
jgi:hypothetical protein